MGITANNEGSYAGNAIAGSGQSGNPSNAEGAGEEVIPSSEATGVYNESEEHVPDATAMTGTLDTTDVAAGPHADLRNVTDSFNASDARAAEALEENDGEYPEVADEGERQDAAQVLRERSGTEPGEDALDAATTAKDNDPVVTSGEPSHAVNDPAAQENAEANGALNSARAEDEGDEQVKAEQDEAFDPHKHTVGDTKKHLETADDDEIQRVIEAEKQGQNRPGIVNFKK